MNAVYNHRQHKLFTNALSCLSRFGDKLNVRCANPEESNFALRLSAINSACTAHCAFLLSADFFDSYELEKGRRNLDVELQMRTLQNVLKVQLNRKLEKCELSLIEDEMENRLAVRLHSFNGVTKTHKLTFEEQRGSFPAMPPEVSEVVIEAKMIQRLLDHFGARSQGEISLLCKREDMTIRSKTDEFIGQNARKGNVTTEVKVDHRSFRRYRVEKDVELVFAMREFKAAIALADHLALPLTLRFSHRKDPIVINIDCPSMSAQIFIATDTSGAEEGSQVDPTQSESAPDESRRMQEEQASVTPRQQSTAQDSDMVLSGRSAGNKAGPLESTAPAVQSGHHAVNHGGPSTSTPPVGKRRPSVEEEELLFFGQSSPNPRSQPDDSNVRLQEMMDQVEGEEGSSRAVLLAATPAPPTATNVDPSQGEPSREEEEDEAEEEEYPLSDEEELPSTQQDSSAKRAKYISLF